jgi:hypothetical protein
MYCLEVLQHAEKNTYSQSLKETNRPYHCNGWTAPLNRDYMREPVE